MTDFKAQRAQDIAAYEERGVKVTEPDTSWMINGRAALRGISQLYMLPWVRPSLGAPKDREYMATKYQDELCERIEDMVMGDYKDDIGSVDELGFIGRVEFDLNDYFELGIVHFWEELGRKLPTGALIFHDDRGFVSYDLFFEDSEQTIDERWSEIESQYHTYWNEQEEIA